MCELLVLVVLVILALLLLTAFFSLLLAMTGISGGILGAIVGHFFGDYELGAVGGVVAGITSFLLVSGPRPVGFAFTVGTILGGIAGGILAWTASPARSWNRPFDNV